MNKLWLKNCSLRIRRGKLKAQLKQKEEAGEVRHEVDFEQLKIENKQYNEKYDDKNQELLILKLKAGDTLQVLNTYKVIFIVYLRYCMSCYTGSQGMFFDQLLGKIGHMHGKDYAYMFNNG